MTKVDGQMNGKQASATPQTANEIILNHPVFGLMRWLANSPTGDEVARELTLNYFQRLGAIQTRLVTTDENGTLRYIGDFGFENSQTGITLEVDQWQALTTEIVQIEIGQNGLGWSSTGKYLQARVNDFGDTRGWITVGFADKNVDHFVAEQLMQILKHVVGIYLASQHNPVHSNTVNHLKYTNHSNHPNQANHLEHLEHLNHPNKTNRQLLAGRDAFTPRQLSILAGMVEGKTNHELASELGFSVSTVRHETMRIYQTLGVSDRREAAREAMERKIF